MPLVWAAILCVLMGSNVVSCCWVRMRPAWADFLLRTCVAFGFGVGILSAVFFLCRVFAVNKLFSVDLAVLFGLSLVLLIRLRKLFAKPALDCKPETVSPEWFVRSLQVTLAIAACVDLYAVFMRAKSFPLGDGWDAFAIWNLHARFLFLGGSHWKDGFTALLPGSHPDYPLLLPAAIAHFWSYAGWDDPRVAAALGLGFTFATAGVLLAALALLRGKVAAMLGAIALLATPFFIEQGTAQYADVPLGFFYLGTVALLCLADEGSNDANLNGGGFLVLAGLSAGFAAWTKNEGLLFLCAAVMARAVMVIRLREQSAPGDRRSMSRAGTSLAAFLIGALPMLVLIAYFKHAVAPPSELFADTKAVVGKLVAPSRYWAIIQWYGKGFLRFGHWALIPGTLSVAGFYFAAGKDERFARQAGFRTSVLALILTLVGYFAVYLVTPYDLYWHLRFSLTRLFLQVWPSAVFLAFLVIGDLPRTSAGKYDI
jgi:hypothetical protein